MLYRKLGQTGIDISQLSLGTMTVLKGGTVAEKLRLYDAAYERGVNYFDTSDNYENGESERFLGKFLKDKDRSKIYLGTKCFFPKPEYPAGGLSRENITQTVERSLQRMETDYIDIFYCHRYDPNTPVEETITAIQSLIDQGKIRHWGVSSFSTAQLCEIYYTAREMKCGLPSIAQYPYNLFNRTIEMDLKEAISKLTLGVIGYYPLAQGVLTGKYSNSSNTDNRASDPLLKKQMWDLTEIKLTKVSRFLQLAADLGVSPAALALRWSLHYDAVCSTLSNVNNFNQLEENLQFISVDLSPEVTAALERIFHNAPANPYTGQKF
ncbi:MAG: aldo/keto reductase [Bacteroidetes bacterium]|nr:aldo/keto reductase [Bacteroidota bacterium]